MTQNDDGLPRIEVATDKSAKVVEECPYRVLTTYQADDGRRIEVYQKTGSVKTEYNADEKPEFLEGESLFLGVAVIHFPQGAQEVKFAIADANDIQEAFEKFHENAAKVVEMIRNKQRQSIVAASSRDMDMINQADQLAKKSSIIHP